ncbi:hypothetical protein ACPWR0_17265 [Pandoraea pneumonica]
MPSPFSVTSFHAYLLLDLVLAAYLGMWNATVPFVLLTRFGASGVVIYEIALATTAIVALPVAAAWVEGKARGWVTRAACATIVVSGFARLAAMCFSRDVSWWIVNDIIAVAAFAAVQPLMTIYPAETVGKSATLQAFRRHRLVANIGRIAGPLLAGVAMLYGSQATALACVAMLGCLLIPFSLQIPISAQKSLGKLQNSPTSMARLRSAVDGLVLKCRLPAERFFSLNDVLLGVAMAGVVPLLIPRMVRDAALQNSSVGWLVAAFTIGSMLGVGWLHPLLTKQLHRRWGFVLMWLGTAVSLTASAIADNAIVYFVSLTISGALGACLAMVGIDRRTLAMPRNVRVRVAGASLLAGQLASSLSFAVYGLALSSVVPNALWTLYAGLAVVVVVLASSTNEPWMMLSEQTTDDCVEGFYVCRYPGAFSAHTRPVDARGE